MGFPGDFVDLAMSLAAGLTGGLIGGLIGGFVGDFVDLARDFAEVFLPTFAPDFGTVLTASAAAAAVDFSDDLLKRMDVLEGRAGDGDVAGTSATGTRSDEVAASRLDADAAGEIVTSGHGAVSPGLTDFKRLTSGLP